MLVEPHIKKGTLLAVILWQVLIVSGQVLHQKNDNLLDKGDKLFVQGNYVEAEACYDALNDSIPDNVDILKRLGVVKVFNRKYDEGITILEPLIDQTDSVDYFVCLQLAIAFHHTYDYGRAREFFAVSAQDSILKERSEWGFRQSEFAEKLLSGANQNIAVSRLDSSVNTVYNELAPHLLLDTIFLYSSDMYGSKGVFSLFGKRKNSLFYSIMDEGEPTKGRQLSIMSKAEITGPDDWELIGYYAAEEMFLYRLKSTNQLCLSDYRAKQDASEITANVDFFDPLSSSVAILPGGKKAFFIREDVTDGSAETNIYSTCKDSVGKWSNIVRLEFPVNTEYNEDFLFWCKEEEALYFSSDRWQSAGGYDIFKAETDGKGNLKPPVNAGFPINTPGNDIFFFKEGKRAWYASDYGQENYDIYRADQVDAPPPPPPPVPWYDKYQNFGDIEQIREFSVCGNIYYDTYEILVDTANRVYQQLLNVLLNNEDLKVRLTGYADWTGNVSENNRVSFLRATELYYALCMDGVDSRQISIDFKGSMQPRTFTEIDDPKELKLAMALNRCVTVEPIAQGEKYLYVAEDPFSAELLSKKPAEYAIMLHISSEQLDPGLHELPEPVRFFKKDKVFFYHTPPSSDLVATAERMGELKTKIEGLYIFVFRQAIDF